MKQLCKHEFRLTSQYRTEEPFYLPSEKTKQRHKEEETRQKNRAKRKRLKRNK